MRSSTHAGDIRAAARRLRQWARGSMTGDGSMTYEELVDATSPGGVFDRVDLVMAVREVTMTEGQLRGLVAAGQVVPGWDGAWRLVVTMGPYTTMLRVRVADRD